jgi:hypothetical protein
MFADPSVIPTGLNVAVTTAKATTEPFQAALDTEPLSADNRTVSVAITLAITDKPKRYPACMLLLNNAETVFYV